MAVPRDINDEKNLSVMFVVESCLPQRIDLYPVLCLPRRPSQLHPLPLATGKGEQRKMSCLEVAVFRLANFSSGASNLWLCWRRGRGVGTGESSSRLPLGAMVSLWVGNVGICHCVQGLSVQRKSEALLPEGGGGRDLPKPHPALQPQLVLVLEMMDRKKV